MGLADRRLPYLELPSEQLTASTPAEFAQLLNRVMTTAGMRASEVTVKAGKEKIPRSQAYSMVSANRTTLPSKPEQVRGFLHACRLAELQVAMVMEVWAKLDRQARETQQALERPAEALPRLLEDQDRHPSGSKAGGHKVIFDNAPLQITNTFLGRLRHTDPVTSYRPNAFVDLVSLILESEARTRRALRLLIPIVVGFVVIVAMFTTWAMLQPSHINVILAAFATLFALPIASLTRGVRTRR